MKIDLPQDSKYAGWALARQARDHPGMIVEHGAAQAIFDPATHVFTLRVEGHPPVVVSATGPRSTRVVGAPAPTNYDAFWYLVEGFIQIAFDPTAPNSAFAGPA
jgi:hypothetical protein